MDANVCKWQKQLTAKGARIAKELKFKFISLCALRVLCGKTPFGKGQKPIAKQRVARSYLLES
jgi:hypothetical protein